MRFEYVTNNSISGAQFLKNFDEGTRFCLIICDLSKNTVKNDLFEAVFFVTNSKKGNKNNKIR